MISQASREDAAGMFKESLEQRAGKGTVSEKKGPRAMEREKGYDEGEEFFFLSRAILNTGRDHRGQSGNTSL